MPSRNSGHEVGRGSALVAFGGKALLPFLDGHHGPALPQGRGEHRTISRLIYRIEWHPGEPDAIKEVRT